MARHFSLNGIFRSMTFSRWKNFSLKVFLDFFRKYGDHMVTILQSVLWEVAETNQWSFFFTNTFSC